MAKRIEIDGKHFRIRRGRRVEIPKEWVDKTLHKQTKMKRRSKRVSKHNKRLGIRRGG